MLSAFFTRTIVRMVGYITFLAIVFLAFWPFVFTATRSTGTSIEKIYFSFAYDHAFGHVTGFETLKVFQTSPRSGFRKYPASGHPHQLDEKQPTISAATRKSKSNRKIQYLEKRLRFSKIEYEKSNGVTGITFALKNVQLNEFWRDPSKAANYNIDDVLELYIHPDDDRIVSHAPTFIDYVNGIVWLGSILGIILIMRYLRNRGKRKRSAEMA